MKVLLAADGFLTPRVLEAALERHNPGIKHSFIKSTWPTTPFHDIAEVKEALGDEAELIKALQDCEIAFTHTYPFTKRVIESCPKLQLITVCRGGPVNINVEAATKNNVAVTSAPGRNATSTAEHSIAMILATVRKIAQHDSEVKNGVWGTDYYLYENASPEIASSTVGVIGLGAVGHRVASAMAALGAEVIVFDPYLKDKSSTPGFKFVETLDDLLKNSRIVTIHARVTPDNYHMIDSKALAKIPEGSYLINCARGPLVDYEAVCDALESGHLAGAGFDCLPEEPLPKGHRLLSAPRVTITPHLAGASKESAQLAAEIGSKDIKKFIDGELPDHILNPEVLGR
ncbi:2-hydroxyacid dehydrogenase [Propionimicrobium lymphophilum]|uniref:2-hydroxyacid dehydrogenase n=1 Tax=Propionimicrobium lymphophilum TaxID=33012 RepID=UPI003EC7B63F